MVNGVCMYGLAVVLIFHTMLLSFITSIMDRL